MDIGNKVLDNITTILLCIKTAHVTTHIFKSVSFDVQKCQQEKVVVKQKGHFCVLTFLSHTLFLFFYNQPMTSQCFIFFFFLFPSLSSCQVTLGHIWGLNRALSLPSYQRDGL